MDERISSVVLQANVNFFRIGEVDAFGFKPSNHFPPLTSMVQPATLQSDLTNLISDSLDDSIADFVGECTNWVIKQVLGVLLSRRL